ncbi:prepilin-type N-terminal cleavage/methylation domain-containing protein [Planococcus maritimus]|uniref:prepilin-type N-terminal cleavage/methylation domain-containing protein n=1 Tax=Planococcus maritimus TaxID=192421 RepID=UPI003139702D
MKKFIQNKLKDQKGLTLIELLAVIVILAIIAAIAIPAIGNIIENSRYSAVKSDALNTLSAANIYFAENPTKTKVTTSTLDSGYLDNAGKIPVAVVGSETAPTNNFVEKLASGDLAISTTAITYAGAKTVTFTGATVTKINADENKGSSSANKTIN